MRPAADLDHKEVVKEPLLSSVYAETLRVYVNVYAVVTSPHEDVRLGQYFLPKKTLAVMNSAISHMDTEFWNTQGQRHPVQSFWAERFLVDPKNPSSGPVRPECRSMKPGVSSAQEAGSYFTTQDLDGSWYPYGGKI